ncbi:PREDICTED: CCA tRNA nucleotidyltransferase 1, mitochondrial-like isoform X1 [Branchiostoma belcheri]|uniref:CCA tRNA nucleotidyltransferase 1, mitochondrial-like isoform X1 n=2 Tax=Branchiostoma belcheri TaxID=7741 RepID=A0A6P4XNG7_BRABE|nr:PREDICTED: CCA tRNA nucleotidyltransferase 1, mitochondrial-like isoform X1 [Branchiostoma belcheri]
MLAGVFRSIASGLKHTRIRPQTLQHYLALQSLHTNRTMKLDKPEFKNLFTPELNRLSELFAKYEYELRIAGGAVRDILMGKQPQDLDFATTATPEEMKVMFEKEGVRMLNTRGEEHGTITARINNKENFEVTTLRVDVVTDGRHAEVEFTTDWKIDAERRDLTINSMFLGLDGTLYDYFDGWTDLQNRRVAFVGDATKRIQEDYLRILRYFRFYGRIAEMPNQHEDSTLEAIRENAGGLGGISGERIWTELKKIVVGNHAAPIMRCMYNLGLPKYIGLPLEGNLDEFDQVYARARDLQPRPMTMVAALLEQPGQMDDIITRLKISIEERKTGLLVMQLRREGEQQTEQLLKHYQGIVLKTPGTEQKQMSDRVCEVLKYQGDASLLSELQTWTIPRFPVTGKHLMEKGIFFGAEVGWVKDKLVALWIESDCSLTFEELMARVDDLRKEVPKEIQEKAAKKKTRFAKKMKTDK